MKTIAEIADEYERNLIPLRQRRTEVKAQFKSERNLKLRIRLWHRAVMLEDMIDDGVHALQIMRGDIRG